MEAKKRYTAGSLFSGIGGIDLAFALAGFDILFQVEIDEFCQKVLKRHSKEYWPNAAIINDVRAVGKRNLPFVDVLFGGFPCQDISQAGKRAGLVAGKRSSLWFEFARIIGEIRPSIVLLENVTGITTPRTSENGEVSPPDMAVVIDTLASMGYSARWGIIAAADANAPQQRNRWFCVAYPERRGLLSSPATTRGQNAQNKKRHIETGYRANVTRSPEPNRSLLRKQKGLAYTHSQRRGKIAGHRAKERERLIGTSAVLGNAKRKGLQGQIRADLATDNIARPSGGLRKFWRSAESRVGRNAHGLSKRLDGDRLMNHQWPARPGDLQHENEPPRLVQNFKNRRNRIKALGNAVVPQVVYPIAIEIKKLLERE